MSINWKEFSFKKLGEGIWNTHFDVKQEVEQVAEERMEICRKCEYNSTNKGRPGTEKCLQCGCVLRWKTHSLSSSCPLEKWKAIEGVTDDLSNHIDTITGND